MEQFVRAARRLYDPNTSREAHKEADEWLHDYQRSAAAWEVCELLSRDQELPVEVVFLAAQTLKEKVRYDFSELNTPERRRWFRDTVVAQAVRLQADGAVRTQLALVVATLAIHMVHDWGAAPSPLHALAERLASPADFSLLLDILTVAPEEASNTKVQCTPSVREEAEKALASFSRPCLGVLESVLLASGANRPLQRRVLRCFLSWVTFGCVEDADLVNSRLFSASFEALAVPELFDVSMDIVAAMALVCGRIDAYPNTTQALVPRVMALVPQFERALAENMDDVDLCRQYCSVFAQTGVSLMPLVVQASPTAIQLAAVILKCSAHPSPLVANRAFPFWHGLRRHLVEAQGVDAATLAARRALFSEAFAALARALFNSMRWPDDFERILAESRHTDEYDDLRRFRHFAGDCLGECCEILGAGPVLAMICSTLQATWGAYCERPDQWQAMEALLFGVRSIAKHVLPLPSHDLIMDVLALLPEFKGHHQPRYTALLIAGRYASLLRQRRDLLARLLTFVVDSLEVKSVVPAAVQSFRHVCDECGPVLADPAFFEQLLLVLDRYVVSLPLPDSTELIEGMAQVVARMSDDRVPEAVRRMLVPLVDSMMRRLQLPAAEQRGRASMDALCEDLERVSLVFQKIDKAASRPVVAQALAGLLPQLWQPFLLVLQHFSDDEDVMEKLCMCWKHGILKTGPLFEPLLVPLVRELAALYPRRPQSCFVYVASVLVRVFGPEARMAETLSEVFRVYTEPTLQLLGSAQAFAARPSIAEDYFELVAQLAQTAPDLLASHPLFPAAFRCSVLGLCLEHRDASAKLLHSLAAVVSMAGSSARASEAVRSLLAQHGQELVCGLMDGLGGRFQYSVTRHGHEVLEALLAVSREALLTWMGAALGPMTATVDPTKAEFMEAYASAGASEVRKQHVYSWASASRRARR